MPTQAKRRARPAPTARRATQPERSAAMRARLTRAAIDALVEKGYARTTAVEVCARVGVSRGAFHHHFSSLAALYAEALRTLYRELAPAAVTDGRSAAQAVSLERVVHAAWATTRRREFKAVIEIWLAARNDAALGAELAPVIEQLSTLFSPAHNPRLAQRLGKSARAADFYRLVMEAMIGMALGRAVSPNDKPLAHEGRVVRLLASLGAAL